MPLKYWHFLVGHCVLFVYIQVLVASRMDALKEEILYMYIQVLVAFKGRDHLPHLSTNVEIT
jgi:hypothetical protein